MSSDFDSKKSFQVLNSYFEEIKLKNYGGSKSVKIPFFGGYIELDMSFNNGMIDLHAASVSVLGEVEKSSDFYLGYTDSVGMARTTSVVLKKFSDVVDVLI